jgi:hypothetical protein|eukprot:COSAG01_NODE_2708_length_7219_cov_2.933146_9_plen_49_part_00
MAVEQRLAALQTELVQTQHRAEAVCLFTSLSSDACVSRPWWRRVIMMP